MKRSTPTSRRQFLVLGGAATAGAAALAACSSTPVVQSSGTAASTVTPATAPTTTEAADLVTNSESILRTATSLEASIVAFYDKMLAAAYLTDPAAKSWARTIQSNHVAHVAALKDLTRSVGAKPYEKTNAQVDAFVIVPKLALADKARSAADLVSLAVELEEAAASTMTLAVGSLGLPSTRQSIMAVGAGDARHHAVWNLYGSNGDLASAAPDAMQSLRDALPSTASVDA